MSFQELKNLINFTPNRGNLVGEPGSVIGQTDVTAINLSTNAEETVIAQRDGSFAIPLVANKGDSVRITAGDGLLTLLTVP